MRWPRREHAATLATVLWFVFPIASMTLPVAAQAQNVALLLFDGSTGTKFAGCLNCSEYDRTAVCNRYGDFGSEYSDDSIWNRYGKFGSEYEKDSPWNRYGEGLRVVDTDGNYYGRFTLSFNDQSRHPVVQSLLGLYEKTDNLEAIRDILCN